MAAASIIGQGTTVRGNIRGPGSVEIRGRVEGDVEVDGDVAIGENGGVNGNISGAQILVAGQVAGDLRGTEAVLLERGARVAGDLVAPRIGIAEGALVRGAVKTEGDAPAPRRAAVLPTRRGAERPEFGARPKPMLASVPKSSPTANAAPLRAAPAPAAQQPQTQVGAAGSNSGSSPEASAGPPAPVVPALGKAVKGKKKNKRS